MKLPEEITVSTIEFDGLPAGSELLVSTIQFDGLEPGAELSVSTIKYPQFTIQPQSKPLFAKPSSNPISQQTTTSPPECTSPSLEILSPTDKQVVNGDLHLQIGLFCTTGSPPVQLEWVWYPESVPGQWPDTALQQSVSLVPLLSGQYEITIPGSQFPQNGNYHVRATMETGPNLQNSDMKRFVVSKVQTMSQGAIQKNRFKQSSVSIHEIKNFSPPVIIQPRENQKIAKPQRVKIHATVFPGTGKIAHQVEWKSFTSKSFQKEQGSHFSYQPQLGSHSIVGRLSVKKKGVYRIRLKSAHTGSSWGKWRTFSVGSKDRPKLNIIKSRAEVSGKKLNRIKPTIKIEKNSLKPVKQKKIKKKKKIIQPTMPLIRRQ